MSKRRGPGTVVRWCRCPIALAQRAHKRSVYNLKWQAAGYLSAITDSLVPSARRISKVQKSVDLVDGMARGIADANEGAH